MLYTIHPTRWQLHQADLIKIRTEVFMQEQQVSAADEWDGLDEQAQHFLILSPSGAALGCARLLHEKKHGQSLCHIGRVAILKPFRNKGLGHDLMRFIIGFCKTDAPVSSIYLHAQIERRHFYETLGFTAEGNEFMDAGISHISMHLA
jgi:predicted GNAT family N-acyltransferase